jgi:hypothetical protein
VFGFCPAQRYGYRHTGAYHYLQIETNAGNFVIFNPVTGDYQFFCNGVLIASGTGTANVRGCLGTITIPSARSWTRR